MLSNVHRIAGTLGATLLFLALLALSAMLGGCASAHPSADAAVREEPVQFAEGNLTLTGVLFTPASSPILSRRPAIVLMHGCGGMVDSHGALVARNRDWAERFARWGFVTLVADSFSPRGIKRLCELKDRPIQPWNERTLDAYAALDYLVKRNDVDPNAVFVLGWSHGGSTVMGVVRPDAPGRQVGGAHFRAAVAFYPGCTGPLHQKAYRPTMPLLILHGEADDWVPAEPCVELGKKLQGAGLSVQTVTYPDAQHGFDAPTGRVQFLPGVYNPRMPNERGAHVGPNPEARRAAIEEVRRFVEHSLNTPRS